MPRDYSAKYERKRYVKKDDRNTDYLRPYELPIFFDDKKGIIQKERDWVMLGLMAYCGLRIGEVTGREKIEYEVQDQKNPKKMIKVKATLPGVFINDINFDEKELRVHGKGDKIRYVPLPNNVLHHLHLWLKGFDGDNGRLIVRIADNPEKKDIPISTQNARAIWSRYLKTSEIGRKIRCHDLRHTFAMEFLRRGGNPRVLMEPLGHSSMSQTMNYLHSLTREEEREESRRIWDNDKADVKHRGSVRGSFETD